MAEPGDPGSSHLAGGHVHEGQPRFSCQPGLGLSHAPIVFWPGRRIGCTRSSTLGPKSAALGAPAASKQPS